MSLFCWHEVHKVCDIALLTFQCGSVWFCSVVGHDLAGKSISLHMEMFHKVLLCL